MSECIMNGDVTCADRYVGDPYIQHNPYSPNGKAAVVNWLKSNSVTYTPGGVIGNCDIAMVYGRYGSGLGPKPKVAVDIFRVTNGRISEHWDIMQDEVPADQTVS